MLIFCSAYFFFFHVSDGDFWGQKSENRRGFRFPRTHKTAGTPGPENTEGLMISLRRERPMCRSETECRQAPSPTVERNESAHKRKKREQNFLLSKKFTIKLFNHTCNFISEVVFFFLDAFAFFNSSEVKNCDFTAKLCCNLINIFLDS